MAYSWLAMLVKTTISALIEFCLKTIDGSLYTYLMFINTNNKIVNQLNMYKITRFRDLLEISAL